MTTDLITFAELTTGAMASAPALANHRDAVEAIIADVSEEICTFLGRQITVFAQTIQPERYEWMPSGNGWTLWAPEWPVVQVLTPGVTILPDRPGGQLLFADSPPYQIELFAGYRRSDQDLATLAIDGLTKLPPTLPGLIRSVAINLCLFYASQRVDGTIGRGRRMTTGQMTTTVESPDSGYPKRELARLQPYRKL